MSDRVHWLELPSALASEALLDLLDPGLEHSHVLLQLCERVGHGDWGHGRGDRRRRAFTLTILCATLSTRA
jgi:hypothetical protein